MKRLFFAITAAILVASCSKNIDSTQPVPDSNVMLPEPSELAGNSEDANATPEQKGQKLVEGGDCMGCHKLDTKLVGPSFQEMADRYTESDIEKLAQKIIDGGSGSWGTIPMTPHAGLSQDNAKLMVQYILSTKK